MRASQNVLATLAVMAAIYVGAEVWIPLVVSILLFFLLDPVVVQLERKRISRSWAAPVLVSALSLAIIMSGWGVYEVAGGFTNQMPRYSEKIRAIGAALQKRAAYFEKGTQSLLPVKPTTDIQKVEVVTNSFENWSGYFVRGVNSAFAIIANIVLIPLLLAFFLVEKDILAARLSRLFGSGPIEASRITDRIRGDMEKMVHGYFFGNLAVGLSAAVGFYLLFLVLGLENKLALAMIAGFLNVIPIFGTILGAILPVLQALLQFDSFQPIVWICVGSVALHFLVNNIVLPKMVGPRINVNASAATVGFLFWGWAWGGVGLFLAIPLMAACRILLSTGTATQAWGNLISENPMRGNPRSPLGIFASSVHRL